MIGMGVIAQLFVFLKLGLRDLRNYYHQIETNTSYRLQSSGFPN